MTNKYAVSSPQLKKFLEATKKDTKLIGQVERHILTRPTEFRERKVIHPSELIKGEWCKRAAYFAILGQYVPTEDKPSLRRQSIFDEGHAIHAKWQGYIREMGNLYGMWSNGSWDISANVKGSAKYREVPLSSPKHMISGHADGWVKGLGEDFLIEIKSIGTGTIRMEAPHLLTGDIETSWKNIKNPFRTHILQGQVYLHLTHIMAEEGRLESAPNEIVFIYELKANQDYKEFVVTYDPKLVEEFFDCALDVVWAVEHNRSPVCSVSPKRGYCKSCEPYKEVKDVNK